MCYGWSKHLTDFRHRTQRKHLKTPLSPLLIDKCLEKHDEVLSVCPHNANVA